jgi:hypothetical protein
MVSSFLKWFIGIALALAVAWTAWGGVALLLPALGLSVLCVVLLLVRSSNGSGLRAELLHDPSVSTLVFPPESKLPPR